MRLAAWFIMFSPMLFACVPPVAVPDMAVVVTTTDARRPPADVGLVPVTELDCSILRLVTGRPYCRVIPPPPSRPPFCTRSLAGVDCWNTVDPFGYYQREVADGARTLTPEQEHDRTGRWPAPIAADAPGGPAVQIVMPPAAAP